MNKRKIGVVLVDRANYGRLWPVMNEIKRSNRLELQTICSGTMLLDRFGQAEHIVQKDGFEISGRVYLELEGSIPTTMAKSIGIGIMEFSSEFQRLKPDILLVIGDRYEALAAVIAAAYQNITIAHIQGGEVSGSIDESARHAITKFSHYHFPATERARSFLIRMGEKEETVVNVGCPCGDFIMDLKEEEIPVDAFKLGTGYNIDPRAPFFLVIFHPVTTMFGRENDEAQILLDVLHEIQHPTVWLWPNIDAGSDFISKALRRYRESNEDTWLHLIKNFEPRVFQLVLKQATCAIGNSSSFIRDSTFSGTPVVLYGDRQEGRECGENLLRAENDRESLKSAILSQLEHGGYLPSRLYGDGTASKQIVRELERIPLYSQKRLAFV